MNEPNPGRPPTGPTPGEALPAVTRPDAGAAEGSPTPYPGPGTELPTRPGGPEAPLTVPGTNGDATAAPRRPRIGDTRPAPSAPPPNAPSALPPNAPSAPADRAARAVGDRAKKGAPDAGAPRRAGGQRPTAESLVPEGDRPGSANGADDADGTGTSSAKRAGRSRRRSGRERRGKVAGRYLVGVHVSGPMTQIAVLEGRSLVEHYVSHAADDTTQIDGNIYRGRVQNVLPGMEAAFIDIGIPKNAVLYRGDVRYDREDVEGGNGNHQPRIEDVLRAGQSILCQVTKNPIGAKGARLTQEVSLPGRFTVLVPNSTAFGISKRLGDAERRRLRRIVDDVKPPGHGMIIRTAAEGASADELRRDVETLLGQWRTIEETARKGDGPRLLHREPDLAVRILREELNSDYRAIMIDDPDLHDQVRDYVGSVSPELADRIEYYDPAIEPLPLFERFHIHEQLHKALDRKVWLPSGGSLIIERTEALTVIDVNTGKNVGSTNLEETVFRNNLEAAEEVARQLRLRDIGGIIVIDFIDMEVRENRDRVASSLRSALARDKTRTQIFDISDLGLVEMTRKRISEGLIESLSTICDSCDGRGIVLDHSII